MLTLLLAAWMAMPMYPLNPTAEDTLNTLNVHVSVGVTSPNRLAAPGPNISAKTELLLKHPWVVRATAEYSYATIESNLYPDGDLHGLTLGVDGLYYRGTEDLTGFIGAGMMYYHGYITTDGRRGRLTLPQSRHHRCIDERTVRGAGDGRPSFRA